MLVEIERGVFSPVKQGNLMGRLRAREEQRSLHLNSRAHFSGVQDNLLQDTAHSASYPLRSEAAQIPGMSQNVADRTPDSLS